MCSVENYIDNILTGHLVKETAFLLQESIVFCSFFNYNKLHKDL
jgi:hypothetical protein